MNTPFLNPELRWEERVLQVLLLGFSLFLPISISLAEPLAFLVFPFWLYHEIRTRDFQLLRNPYFWPVLLFSLVVFLSPLWSIRPDVTLHKVDRSLLFFILFAMAAAFKPNTADGWDKFKLAIILFVVGTTLRGFYDIVRVPIQMSQGISLYDTGNMRDPQMYMVALTFLIAGISYRAWTGRKLSWITAGLANAAGLVLHCKRGVWISFLLVVGLMSVMTRRYKIILIALLAVIGLMCMPQIRERVEMLKKETSVRRGGRLVLWVRVAPEMLKDYPMGLGWCATRHEDLQSYSMRVQPGLNHLHNNILQVALELGWLGLAIWLGWMGTAIWVLVAAFRASRAGDADERWLALGALGGFCGLLLNGMVEYNFGDAEILMLLCFLMGASGVVRARQLYRVKGTP